MAHDLPPIEKRLPWFEFWYADFEDGTRQLDDEHAGFYLRFLIAHGAYRRPCLTMWCSSPG